MTRKHRDRLSPRAGFGLLIAFWVVPVLVAATALVLADRFERAAIVDEADPVVTVGSVVDDASSPVTVTLVSGRARELISPIGGTVTSLSTELATDIEGGAVAMTVDRRAIRWFVADSPLVGDVAPGSAGTDVRLVAEHLGVDGSGDRYTAALRAAIDARNGEGGWPRDGVFRASSVLFASPLETSVGLFEAQVGSVVTGGGRLGEFSAPILEARLAPLEGVSADARLTEGSTVLVFADGELPVVGTTVVEPELTPLLEAIRSASLPSTRISDTEVQYQDATWALAEPEEYGVVPSSALIAADDGTPCIVAVDGDEMVAVEVQGTSSIGVSGTSVVPASLIGAQVLRVGRQAPTETQATCT